MFHCCTQLNPSAERCLSLFASPHAISAYVRPNVHATANEKASTKQGGRVSRLATAEEVGRIDLLNDLSDHMHEAGYVRGPRLVYL